mgnify:FL=1
MTRKLSPEQVDLLRQLYLDGEKMRTIAERVGCSIANVDDRARRMGLPRRTVSSGDLPQREIVRAYVDDRVSAESIAGRFGCDRFMITRILRMRGVRIRGRHGNPPDLRAECVRMFRSGLHYHEIGKRLGISVGQVGRRVRSVLGKGARHDGSARRAARRKAVQRRESA